MQRITSNQYIIIAAFCILTSKIMTMPTIIYSFAGKDAIFSIVLNMLVDLTIVILITGLIQKYPNTTFLDLLTKKFTRFGAVVLSTLLVVFILFKGVFLLQETLSFFTLALYEKMNLWLLLIPAIMTILYISYKGLNALGRSIDIYWIFVFATIIIILIISITQADFSANLPYFENGFLPVLKGSAHSSLYVGNGLVLLFFMGKVEHKPRTFKFTVIFSIVVTLFIILDDLIFYCLFTDFVPYCTFALSNLSQYSPFVTDLGHIGWLSIVESTINLIFISSICCYCVRQYLQFTFKISKKIVSTLVCGAMYLGIMYIFDFTLYNMLDFVKNWGFYYNLGLIPLMLTLCIVLLSISQKSKKTIKNDLFLEENAKCKNQG